MARPLDQFRVDDALDGHRVESARRVDRSAAMAFGAAIASLLVAALVVNQSTAALEPAGSIAGNSLQAGTITLADDDTGRSLVSLDAMVPGRPAQECIEVSYEGTITPVAVSLDTLADGPLAPYVTVEVDRGGGGGYGRCGELTGAEQIYRGTLADLARAEALTVATWRNTGERTSFRFRFHLADDAAAKGQATTVDFRWEAVPV